MAEGLPSSKQELLNLTQEALGHLAQGFTVFTEDLKLALFNQKFVELLEFPSDLIHEGTAFLDLIRHNAERGEYGEGDIEQQIQSRFEMAKKFEAHSFQRTRPDGTVIQIDGSPLPGGGFVTTYTDITEKIKSAEFLRSIVEASPAGFVVSRASDGHIAFSNGRAADILRYGPTEILDEKIHNFFAIREERNRLFERTTQEDEIRDVELQLRRKDGSFFDGLVTVQPTEFQGSPCYFSWFNDVSAMTEAWAKIGDSFALPKKTPYNINTLFMKAVEKTRPAWCKTAHIEVEIDEDLPHLPCYPSDLLAVFSTLIVRSCGAIGNRQTIDRSTQMGKVQLKAQVADSEFKLQVVDSGIQTSVEALQKALNSEENEEEISIEKTVANLHDGSLSVSSDPSGSSVTMLLPL